MSQETTATPSEWKLFFDIGEEMVKRTKIPLRHPSFVIFFSLAVVGLGGLGIWLELYSALVPVNHAEDAKGALEELSTNTLRTAFITFFPAVAGTSAMQLIWAESSKHFRSVAALLLFCFLVTALLIFPSRVSNTCAISLGVLMSLLSLWVWWIANAKQEDLLDKIDLDAPVGGGNPRARLNGDTTGWNT
ncbi:hypothetical protein [Pseudoxanthomonas sp.]|uniref:hypothetical protein n=1 Tax=Pseudoxanthomonas sp. TaxID=1871049 RepID=UPI002E14EAC3|nr:hypothetical protein [Pseudoxanthomonas sp.]